MIDALVVNWANQVRGAALATMPALPLPAPRLPGVTVRDARVDDLPFIDQLQKMHSHMVGFLQRTALTKYISAGHVIIAEEVRSGGTGVSPVGYCIAKDQYMKRDDVGIVYQLNVLPLKQRHLVGASLIKAVFDRAAYGCKLFSCWCAQDIQANWFWESIGFIPLAFRTGSRSKQRTHIFWQRRIREGDDVTPYWFPSQTENGAVGEDRIVLPIPPGTHWRDAKPLVLPGIPGVPQQRSEDSDRTSAQKVLPGGAPVRPRDAADTRPKLTAAQKAVIHRTQSKHLGGVPLGKKAVLTASGIKYIDRTDFVPELDTPQELAPPVKPKRTPKPRAKNDPKFIKAARDLRDKFLEQVNSGQWLPVSDAAKYDVCRALPTPCEAPALTPLLDAA